MRFRMLGPLEVVDGDRSVGLGGTRQRATLGFLLLHANRVVASSQLIEALWPAGRAPQSARKILQNSVWRLRRALNLSESATGSVALLSQAPGYMLRVDPDRTDLHHFKRMVEQGRAKLAAGFPEAATLPLHDALSLWRGPVLADLVEAGIDWPELISVQNARLDALEDYFEAELACGHHHRVLVELERTVTTEPLRERLLGQLMLALYRSGRQTDALEVYYGARTVMVERLGLEPGHQLQALQHAILMHDPELVPDGMRRQLEQRMTGTPAAAPEPAPPPATAAPAPAPDPISVPPSTPAPAGSRAAEGKRPDGSTGEAPPTPPRTLVAERKEVSVLIVRVQVAQEPHAFDAEEIDALVERAAVTVREEVECLGGTVVAAIGSIRLVLFGVPRAGQDDAERAVHAALTVRDRLAAPTGPGDTAPASSGEVSVQVAVATGEALVRYQPDAGGIPPSVNGALLDECHALLSRTPAGEVHVCDNTRRLTEFAFTHHRDAPSAGWRVGGFRQEYVALHAVPVIDREYDLDVLRGLLRRTRYLSAPHLVTVLGEPGVGKTRFVMEFERRVAADPEAVRFLVSRVRPAGDRHPLEALHDLLLSCCGVQPADRPQTRTAKLAATAHRLFASEEDRGWLLSCLGPLADPDSAPAATGDVLAAARQLLAETAARGPLVVVFEDLHWADETLTDFVEDLTRSVGPLPLFVITTARPELLKRRLEWGAGNRHALTLTLEPISDAAVDRLLEFLTSTTDSVLKNSAGGLLRAMVDGAGAQPAVRRGQLRRILASGSASLRDERCSGVNGG
ncbi:BTAD domain-containing putative transcriptional regulator [Streptomyces sp. NPDC055254]